MRLRERIHKGARKPRDERAMKLKPPHIRFEGGTGLSIEDAVIIRGALFDIEGTAAEFKWLEAHFGRKDRDWKLRTQYHGVFGGRDIDTFELRSADGTPHRVYFDCTSSFGIWPSNE